MSADTPWRWGTPSSSSCRGSSTAFRRDRLPVPLLAARVCTSPFDLALHDAFGRLCRRPVYETYNAGYLNADLAHFLEPEAGVDFSGPLPPGLPGSEAGPAPSGLAPSWAASTR